jgi:hypothetical protein
MQTANVQGNTYTIHNKNHMMKSVLYFDSDFAM